MSGNTKSKFTLQDMAQAGYIMGLGTIGEVASHMELHYDAYFSVENYSAERAAFEELIDGREDDSIFKYLSELDKQRMDDELEQAMKESPEPPPDFDLPPDDKAL